MSTQAQSAGPVAPELVWLGDGVWAARDTALAEADARRLIAYIEHRDHRVYVLWVRDRREVCCYETLREALHDITLASNPDVVASATRA